MFPSTISSEAPTTRPVTDMFSKEFFSKRISSLRTQKNLTQQQLAAAVGLKNTAISMIESAQRAASIEVVYALADYFDVSIDYLVGRSEDPTRR